MSYFSTGAPFDWALANCNVAEVEVSVPGGAERFVTVLGGAGGGTHCSGVQVCFTGSQMLQTLVTGSHTSVKQGATLARTRPLSPLALSLMESNRASPEPGSVVEMVASGRFMTPVAPVQ